MILHDDKCSTLFNQQKGQSKMCDQIVKPMKFQKDLGVLVTKNLTWTTNANINFSKTMRALYYLKGNISNKTSIINKLNDYKGYVVPIISNASRI